MDWPNIIFAFSLTLFAGLATGVGGVIAIARKAPGERFLAGTLGFSVGVMLFVSFVEILPKAVEELTSVWGERGGNWAAIGAFFVGIASSPSSTAWYPPPSTPMNHPPWEARWAVMNAAAE